MASTLPSPTPARGPDAATAPPTGTLDRLRAACRAGDAARVAAELNAGVAHPAVAAAGCAAIGQVAALWAHSLPPPLPTTCARSVTLAMAAHPACAGVVKRGCAALAHLAHRGDVGSDARARGAAAMARLPPPLTRNAAVAMLCMRALLALVTHRGTTAACPERKRYVAEVVRAGGLDAALSSLAAHPGNVPIACVAFHLFSCVLWTDDARLVATGGWIDRAIPPVVRSLAAVASDQDAAVHGSRLLMLLVAWGDGRHTPAVRECGGADALVGVALRHASVEGAAYYTACALRNCATVGSSPSSTHEVDMLRAGAGRAAVAALNANAGSARVAEHATAVINALTTWCRGQLSHLVAAEGAVPCLTAALVAHGSSVRAVATCAVRSLAYMLMAKGPQYVRPFVEGGGVPAVVAAMRAYGASEESAAAYGSVILGIAAGEDGCRHAAAVIGAGAAKAITAAARAHPRSLPALGNVCGALNAIANSGDAGARAVADADGAAVVTAAASVCPGAAEPAAAVLEAVRRLGTRATGAA